MLACKGETQGQEEQVTTPTDSVGEYGTNITLAQPLATASASNTSKVIGWPTERKPIAPAGYHVEKFAWGLQNPRWIYVASNGDIFVAESQTQGASANRINLFRDTNGDGIAENKSVFLENLNRPFGMLALDSVFYVANTDGIWRYRYHLGEVKIMTKGEKILSLPAGGYNNHWTRNLLLNADSTKIYVTVGSGSNVGEHGMENERRRANILEINLDGSSERVFAAGLRNPVGMAWEPTTGKLWVAVNERDELGDQLVPDYITSVEENGFYGWPYAYWGKNPDPRLNGRREDLVAESIIPDFALGAHTASLGLAFSTSNGFKAGAYVGQHGSWNRSKLVGYKVLYVPFEKGAPTGAYSDFLTGFIADEAKGEVYGRPVGVAFTKQGYMLVADDVGNTIWAVVPN
ncbi:sorbosone dehydrogenase family protein [Olivibacter ginsenosidimutans]|uniref:Sorbosone dehydrogenase family protein n=2 Tax=Olivibacter ginsenosidimutans TaxID=1176537 RepID=A0ABP9CAF7_9SPHI